MLLASLADKMNEHHEKLVHSEKRISDKTLRADDTRLTVPTRVDELQNHTGRKHESTEARVQEFRRRLPDRPA